MTKTYTINPGQKPSQEQIEEVKLAKKKPVVFDADCEELSPAMLKAMKSAVIQRNRNKQA